MKKIFYFAAMMALCLSCTKEQQVGSDVIEGDVDSGEVVAATEFSAEFSQEGISKTHLGTLSDGAYPNYWSVGDCINVNGSVSAALGSEYSTNSKTARFLFDNAVSQYGGYWYIGYPAGAFTSFNKGTGTVVVPSSQTYTAGTYDPEAFVMVGKANGKSVKFYPKMGIVRITATDAATPYSYKISKVRLEAIGGESLSGTFTTNYNKALATFTITSGNSYIDINAPTSAGLDFGSTFFFAVPIGTYASGLRFTIYTKDDKSMSFSNASSITVGAGTMKNITSPAYVPSEITLSCTFKTSSSAGFEWTASNSSNNVKKVWRLAIYSDSGCNTLVVQHDIPADPDATGVWTDQGGTPRFVVGGLNQGTNYWCKVTDLANGVSKVLAFTTDAFTVVPASSPSGNTLVAEDFSEFGWGPAWLRGNEGHTYGGWAPVNTTAASNSISCAAPSGVVSTGYYVANEYSANQLNVQMDFTTAPRFNAGWGFVSDGGFTGFIQAGFLRMGGSNANRQLIVLPELSGITTDKYATVDVTVKVAHSFSDDVTNNRNFAVFIERGLTLSNATQRLYTGATLNRRYPVSLTASGYGSQTLTFRVNGVKKTDHLMVGPYNKVTNYNRYFIYSVKVEKVSESATETFDITDSETLELFRSRVAAGEYSLNGNVVNSFTVSSSVVSGWAPIPGYTGTLEGNSKTITGLTQPFFDDLQGTAQNLNLNSNISVTNIDRAGVGILANSLSAGHVEGCAVSGSLTVSYSTSESPSGSCYVGGMVGRVNTGDVTDSENSANITVSGTAKSNLYIGGVVANNTASSFSLVDCRSTGGTISYSGTNPSGALYIGGVVGYSTKPVSGCTSAMTINVGGTFAVGSGNSFYATGGIVGSMSADEEITSCTNSGNITYSQKLSEYGYSYVAGIVGRSEGDVKSCTNSGRINYTGSCLANYSFVGGIIGTAKDGGTVSGTNTGPITINSTTQTGTNFYVGGVAGRAYGITASNSGPITISRLASATAYVGGIVGYAGNNGVGSGSNSGKIEISNFSASDITYIGGVAGEIRNSSGKVQASNEGDITLYNTCSSTSGDLLVGGIAGRTTRGVYGVTNSGDINNAMTVASGNWISIGGIAGENSSGSWVGNDGSSNKDNNTGNLTNTARGGGIRIGGIVGNALGRIRNVYNTGDITNGGNSIDATICVGGIAGITSHDIKNAYNGTDSDDSGAISNSGTSANRLMVAGIYGYSESNGNLSYSDNYGAVTNTGDAPDANAIFIAGAIGLQTNTSAEISNVTNSGAISNNSATSCELEIAGVIADCSGEITGCTNSGPITIGGNVDDHLYIGGVCAWNESYQPMSDCENLSGGTISMAGGLSVTGILYCGGVLGTERGRTALTHSGLINNANITFGSSKTNLISTSNTGWTCIGGCIGGRDSDDNEDGVQDVLNTYNNLENYGKVTYYGNHLVEMGGCVGYAHHLSGTLINRGALKHYVNNGKNSYLGGIVGWLEGDTTLTGAVCVANVDSWESSYRSRTAGIAAGVSSSFTTFSACKYKGNIRGVNSSASVGLICTVNNKTQSISFSDCVIGSGTQVNRSSSYRSITSLALNYDSSNANSVGHLCGSGTSDTNGRTTGSMTNCTIGTVN